MDKNSEAYRQIKQYADSLFKEPLGDEPPEMLEKHQKARDAYMMLLDVDPRLSNAVAAGMMAISANRPDLLTLFVGVGDSIELEIVPEMVNPKEFQEHAKWTKEQDEVAKKINRMLDALDATLATIFTGLMALRYDNDFPRLARVLYALTQITSEVDPKLAQHLAPMRDIIYGDDGDPLDADTVI